MQRSDQASGDARRGAQARPVRVHRPRKTRAARRWRGVDVTLDAQGQVETKVAIQTTSKVDVCVNLAPGMCSLRRLDVAGLKRKEIEPALRLWADESLPEGVEEYHVDGWAIDAESRGLAAVPRAPLERARELIGARHANLARLQVPELRPPHEAGHVAVLFETQVGLVACAWHGRKLTDWQTFPTQLAASGLATLLDAWYAQTPVLTLVLRSAEPGASIAGLGLDRLWPDAQLVELQANDYSALDLWLGASPGFGYVDEPVRQPATAAEKLRVALMLTGMLVAGFFWFFAEVTQLERQLQRKQHTASLLKVQAKRSEALATRTGRMLREVRQLRAMTIERDGVMAILKSLSDVLPPRVRLDSLTVDRGGLAAMDGIAEAEVDVSTLLEQLGKVPLFNEPTLTFTQKDESQAGSDAQSLIRFRVEARLSMPLLMLPGGEPGQDETQDEPAKADSEESA